MTLGPIETGERIDAFYPDKDFSLNLKHFARYLWAIEQIHTLESKLRLPGETIFDAACGAGYGSWLLAINFPNMAVWAGDSSYGAIEYARDRYSAPNLHFVQMDLESDILNADYVIAMEALEHLETWESTFQMFLRGGKIAVLFSVPWNQPRTAKTERFHKAFGFTQYSFEGLLLQGWHLGHFAQRRPNFTIAPLAMVEEPQRICYMGSATHHSILLRMQDSMPICMDQ